MKELIQQIDIHPTHCPFSKFARDKCPYFNDGECDDIDINTANGDSFCNELIINYENKKEEV